MEEKISVIVPTKDGKERIEKCLKSIMEQTYKNWEGFVIDDGSTDGTVEMIREKFPKFNVIVARQGLVENRSIGVYNSSGKYVVMIDDDAYLEKDWISKMKNFLDKHENTAIVGGKILLNKNEIFSAGARISKMGNGYDVGQGESPEKYNNIEKRHYANTTSLMARKELIMKVGLFDKIYFFGYEDMDLGWRCNIAGYDVMYYPEAISHHPPKVLKYREENPYWKTFTWKKTKVLTFLKNFEFFTLFKLSPLFAAIFFQNILFRKNRKQILKAYLWNLVHVWHILRERKEIKKYRKRSDKELFKIFDWSLI